jgi:hypothetical protein
LIAANGSTMLRAVNFADLATSDLQMAAPVKVEVAEGAQGKPVNVRSSLTPYLLAAIMMLLVLESLLVYRRGRPAMPIAGH